MTKQQLRVLKILSRNNEPSFKQLLQRPPEHIDRLIKSYYQRKPVIDDLNSHRIKINDLEDMIYPDFKEELFQKALPILVKWLKKEPLPNHVKASIIHVLIEKPIAKKNVFNIIINIYRSTDPNYRDEWGTKTDLPIFLGNAFLRWADDDHSDIIFKLLDDKKFRDDDFLLSSVSNFKKPENIKKATKLLMQELQKPNLPNARLATIILALRKLKAVEARDLIYPFMNFPNNYKRTIEIDPKKYGYTSDGEVRSEAKKAIAKFDKLTNPK